jgi:hypothetical protein
MKNCRRFNQNQHRFLKKLKELIEKSDRIISIHKTKNQNEYQIQTKPKSKRNFKISILQTG